MTAIVVPFTFAPSDPVSRLILPIGTPVTVTDMANADPTHTSTVRMYADASGTTVAGSNVVNTDSSGNVTVFVTPDGSDGSSRYKFTPTGLTTQILAVQPKDSSIPHVMVGPSGGDDTGNINAALILYKRCILQAGATYLIAGRVTVVGNDSLDGQGHGWTSSGGATLKCTAVGAGLDVVGGNGGQIVNVLVDGNNIATLPYQRLLSGGGGGFKEFRNFNVFNSVADGFTLLGPQNDTYINCGWYGNARDGLYIDKGSGGITFINWQGSRSGRYDIHLDALIAGGPFPLGPQQIQFIGGRSEDGAGVSQLYMRHATDIKFTAGAQIFGPGNSGPTVDIDLANCNLIDLSKAAVTASTGGGSPGHICLQTVNGGGNLWLPEWFIAGDTSWYAGAGTNPVSGPGAVYSTGVLIDGTGNGMVSSNPATISDPNTLIRGRTGPWKAPTLLNSWVNESVTGYPNAGYRITADNELELRGGVKSGASGTVCFNVPLGYRPLSPGLYVTRVCACSGGVAQVLVTYTGDVTITQLSGSVTTVTMLDGLRFPLTNLV